MKERKKNALLIWPPANSCHGPPLGLASIAGHLRNKRPDTNIEIADLNIRAFSKISKEVPAASELGHLVRARWTQSDLIQNALAKWAFGEDAPPWFGELPDWECRYLSLLFADVFDEFISSLHYKPDVIGFSVSDNGFIASMGLTEKLRHLFTDTLIVWGGVSMSEDQALQYLDNISAIDIIVVGEGEQALVEIVETAPLLPPEGIASILTRKTRDMVKADRNTYMPSEPAYDLCNLTAYPALELPMTIARGCFWGGCNFCNENYAGSSYQPIDPVRAAQWALKWQNSYRPISFELIDSAVNSTDNNFDIFVDTLNKGGGLREWRCMLRSSDVHRDMMLSAVKSGLSTVYLGLESLSTKTLNKMNKGITLAQHIRAICILLSLGVNIEGDLILHYPQDNAEEVYHSIELIKRYKHLFQGVSLSYSRFTPKLRSKMGNNPERFDLEVLPYSTRLSGHLSPEYQDTFIPWDPFWRFKEDHSLHTKKLSKAYLQFQATFEALKKEQLITKSWYSIGNMVVLETANLEERILDRVFLEDKQKEIWLSCENITSTKDMARLTGVSVKEANNFLVELAEEGYVYGEDGKWVHAALKKINDDMIISNNITSRIDTFMRKNLGQ